MIDLGTLAGLLERRHRLDAYCSRCDRRAVLSLAAMVAAGHGDRRLPLKVRCSGCGSPGQLHVHPPVTIRSPGGWITPPKNRNPAEAGS